MYQYKFNPPSHQMLMADMTAWQLTRLQLRPGGSRRCQETAEEADEHRSTTLLVCGGGGRIRFCPSHQRHPRFPTGCSDVERRTLKADGDSIQRSSFDIRYSHPEDVENGANVLLRTLLKLDAVDLSFPLP